MNDRSTKAPTARNPQTYLRHRQEVFWQITLPLIIGAAIVLGLALFTAFGVSAGGLSQAADAALIQLIIPALFFGLIMLALLGLSVYGLTRLLGVLPYLFLRIQVFFLRTQLNVMRLNDRLVEPVLRAHSFTARARAFRRSARRAFWFH